jgi:hypothetical protein
MLRAVLATTLVTTRAVPCVFRAVFATTLATTRDGPGDAPILWHGSCRPAPIEIHSPRETDYVPAAESVWGGLELVLWCSLTLLELKNLA